MVELDTSLIVLGGTEAAPTQVGGGALLLTGINSAITASGASEIQFAGTDHGSNATNELQTDYIGFGVTVFGQHGLIDAPVNGNGLQLLGTIAANAPDPLNEGGVVVNFDSSGTSAIGLILGGRLDSVTGGQLMIGDSFADDGGTIAVDGAGSILNIVGATDAAGDFTFFGSAPWFIDHVLNPTFFVTNGGQLDLGGLVTGINNATFSQDGTGKVDLIGQFDGDFTLQPNWGNLYLDGGVLENGTFSDISGGTSALITAFNGGNIENEVIAAPIDVSSVNGATLAFLGGVSLANGVTLTFGGGTSGTNSDNLLISGSQSLTGVGTIDFAGSGMNVAYVVGSPSPTIWTIGPGIVLEGSNVIIGGADSTAGVSSFGLGQDFGIDIQGVVDATGGSKPLYLTLGQSGVVEASAELQANGGGVLNLGVGSSDVGSSAMSAQLDNGDAFAGDFASKINISGTIDNTGAVFTGSHSQTLINLVNATILGGTVINDLQVQSGTFDGVTLGDSTGDTASVELKLVFPRNTPVIKNSLEIDVRQLRDRAGPPRHAFFRRPGIPDTQFERGRARYKRHGPDHLR